eukprot:s30_g11.t1
MERILAVPLPTSSKRYKSLETVIVLHRTPSLVFANVDALRLPVLDPERCTTERWAAEKDFPAEPRTGDVKFKVHQSPDAVKSPLGSEFAVLFLATHTKD